MSTAVSERRQLNLAVDGGFLTEIRLAAADAGMSASAWVREAVREKLHPQGTLEALLSRGAAMDARELEAVIRAQMEKRSG